MKNMLAMPRDEVGLQAGVVPGDNRLEQSGAAATVRTARGATTSFDGPYGADLHDIFRHARPDA